MRSREQRSLRLLTTPPLPGSEKCVGKLGTVRYLVHRTATRFLAVRVTRTSRRLIRDCSDFYDSLQAIREDAEPEGTEA